MSAQLSEKLKHHVDDAHAYAVVATVQPDGRPHLTMVWIKREGDDLLFSTLDSRQQGKNALRDSRVTLLISPPDNPYVYAEIRGTATITPDPDKKLIDELSLKYTGKTFAEYLPSAETVNGRVIVRVTPDKVVGGF